MKIMIAEYSVCTHTHHLYSEGKAMLFTLVKSFERMGNDVIHPEGGNFEVAIERMSKRCDAGLVIAPDILLYGYTKILEENTVNLGCSSNSVRICADKLMTTSILMEKEIPTPKIFKSKPSSPSKYVIKPRYGCASEDVRISTEFLTKEDCITTEFVRGEHISASMIIGEDPLPLTVNEQHIAISEMKGEMKYKGGTVPYEISHKKIKDRDILNMAIKIAEILGCRGYVGMDFVLGDVPYVVDVNPRITTSIIGIAHVIDYEIGDLIMRARFGGLPKKVKIKGSHSFNL
jgi:hypothetical protein